LTASTLQTLNTEVVIRKMAKDKQKKVGGVLNPVPCHEGYQKPPVLPTKWFCGSFIDWLKEFLLAIFRSRFKSWLCWERIVDLHQDDVLELDRFSGKHTVFMDLILLSQ